MTTERNLTAISTIKRRKGGLPTALAAIAFLLGAAVPAAYGSTATEPSFKEGDAERLAPPDTLISIIAHPNFGSFENAGTNPRITDATFSTTEYYNTHSIDEDSGILFIKAKTDAQLRALASPPPSPFFVTVDVTMENDEGQTASGTTRFETIYEQTSATPETPEPSFKVGRPVIIAPTGVQVYALAGDAFNNAGTNPVFTDAVFSATEYYSHYGITEARKDILFVRPKKDAELNALASPPPSPFTVDVTVTMTNDEGQTASGTLKFETSYERIITTPDPTPATFSQTDAVSAAPGATITLTVGDLFDNEGPGARFASVVFNSTTYLEHLNVPEDAPERFTLTVLSEADLADLSPPPSASFTFTADVTMTNDEGQKVSGTVTFSTEWTPPDSGPAPPADEAEGGG